MNVVKIVIVLYICFETFPIWCWKCSKVWRLVGCVWSWRELIQILFAKISTNTFCNLIQILFVTLYKYFLADCGLCMKLERVVTRQRNKVTAYFVTFPFFQLWIKMSGSENKGKPSQCQIKSYHLQVLQLTNYFPGRFFCFWCLNSRKKRYFALRKWK